MSAALKLHFPETKEVENTDEWLTDESLQAMAQTLAACDSKMLADMRNICPAYALSAACELLHPAVRQQIKTWVIEQNTQASMSSNANSPKTEIVEAIA